MVMETEDTEDSNHSEKTCTSVITMTNYFWNSKRIPEQLPHDLSTTEKPLPERFEPQEKKCPYCPGPSPPDLVELKCITRHAMVYGMFTMNKGIPVYAKKCPVCRMLVRFQEYLSGFHNFNDKVILTVPLCSLLTTGLSKQKHSQELMHVGWHGKLLLGKADSGKSEMPWLTDNNAQKVLCPWIVGKEDSPERGWHFILWVFDVPAKEVRIYDNTQHHITIRNADMDILKEAFKQHESLDGWTISNPQQWTKNDETCKHKRNLSVYKRSVLKQAGNPRHFWEKKREAKRLTEHNELGEELLNWRQRQYGSVSGLELQAEENQVNALIYTMGKEAEDILTSLRLTPDEAKHCGYGELHSEMIRDRLVVGLRDKRLSEQLQLDPRLTLEKAITHMRQSDLVKKQQELLKSNFKSEPAVDVGAVHVQQRPRDKGRAKPQSKGGFRTPVKHTEQGRANPSKRCGKVPFHSKYQCPAGEEKGEDSDIAFLGTVNTEPADAPWLIKVKADDNEVLFKVDTGADVTVVPEELYRRGKFSRLENITKILHGPGQEALTVVGMFPAKLTVNRKSTTQDIYVVSGLKTALLGRPAIQALGVIARIDMVCLNSQESVKKQFPELFEGLGKLEGEYEIALKPDAIPFSLSTPRRIPLPLMSKVKQELE
ncbi:hypothetical protein NFI96_001267 [Prochilodus magdalenae]|nr:hypothetical protein NFI96_001267 [Prochilodus magdalenae]